MKRTIQALVVAALFNGTCALADNSNAFPGEAPEMIGVTSAWTYADRSGDKGPVVSAFPGEAPEMIVLTSASTYADGSGNKTASVSAFPGEAQEIIVLESKSTYSDRFAGERSPLARGASDPAAAE